MSASELTEAHDVSTKNASSRSEFLEIHFVADCWTVHPGNDRDRVEPASLGTIVGEIVADGFDFRYYIHHELVSISTRRYDES